MKRVKKIVPTLTGVLLSATLTAAIAAPQPLNIESLLQNSSDNVRLASTLTYAEARETPEHYAFMRDKIQLQQQAITNQLLAGIVIELKQMQLDRYRAINNTIPMTKVQPAMHTIRKGIRHAELIMPLEMKPDGTLRHDIQMGKLAAAADHGANGHYHVAWTDTNGHFATMMPEKKEGK